MAKSRPMSAPGRAIARRDRGGAPCAAVAAPATSPASADPRPARKTGWSASFVGAVTT